MCICVCVHAHIYVYVCVGGWKTNVLRSEDNFPESVPTVYYVGLGIRPRLSGLTACALTHQAILFALTLLSSTECIGVGVSTVCPTGCGRSEDESDELVLAFPLVSEAESLLSGQLAHDLWTGSPISAFCS